MSYDVGTKAVVKRRENGSWWGGEALLDGVEFVDYGTDPTAVVNAFESGEVDMNLETTADFVDILDGLDEIKICTGYRLDDKALDYLPPHPLDQAAVEPIYETVPGWAESTAGAQSWAELPAAAVKYIRRIEELIRCPVALVSTSPERADTILVRDPFAD